MRASVALGGRRLDMAYLSRPALGKEAAFAQKGIGGKIVHARGIQLAGHDLVFGRAGNGIGAAPEFALFIVHQRAVQVCIGVVAGDIDAQAVGNFGIEALDDGGSDGVIGAVGGAVAHAVYLQHAAAGHAVFNVVFARNAIVVLVGVQKARVVFAEYYACGLAVHAEFQSDAED